MELKIKVKRVVKRKSNPKWKRAATSLSNHRYEKQRVRTAANKARRIARAEAKKG